MLRRARAIRPIARFLDRKQRAFVVYWLRGVGVERRRPHLRRADNDVAVAAGATERRREETSGEDRQRSSHQPDLAAIRFHRTNNTRRGKIICSIRHTRCGAGKQGKSRAKRPRWPGGHRGFDPSFSCGGEVRSAIEVAGFTGERLGEVPGREEQPIAEGRRTKPLPPVAK
jgi:hypothetical protein